jgi:hypothetical protein
MLTVENILNKLNRIPHLPLGIEFDANRILEEIQALPWNPVSYKSALSNDKVMEVHEHNCWDSIALYSIDGQVNSNPAEPWEGDFISTDAIKLCPYLDSVLKSVGGGKLLARVETFWNQGTAGWHSHILEARQPEWISIWQLPISMPNESKYSVISYMDYRGSDFLKPIPVYEEWYEPGKMYCLNGYHYHNAFNYSDEPMIMVRFYVDTRESKVQEILETAMANYTQAIIPTYEDYLASLDNS